MADFIIKGMGMPKTCNECPLNVSIYTYDGGDETCALNAWDGYSEQPKTTRHPDCPLFPLPEGHGDLVERKALNLFPDYKDVRNRIKQTIKATERDGRNITGVTIDLLKQTLVALDSLRSVRRYFLNAKTIVPAEGGGEDG